MALVRLPVFGDDALAGRKPLSRQKAQQRWEKLAFTPKKEMTISISGAKQEETKKRRLAKVMQVLKTDAKWTG